MDKMGTCSSFYAVVVWKESNEASMEKLIIINWESLCSWNCRMAPTSTAH